MIDMDRFFSKVSGQSGDGCWLWTGALRYGYGHFRVGGRQGRREMAHRFAYEKLIGPIPSGLDLDHLCRVRNCVNPRHLEPVTRKTNILRGESHLAQQARRLECIHGHALQGENLYVTPQGRRQCKECRRTSLRRLYRRRTA